ncbi:MAG: ATP-binding protein [bacterium]
MSLATPFRWPWARWSLARQLPLITAAIIVLVMVLSLTITYRALVEARTSALLSRQKGLLGVLVQSGENGTKARVTALRLAARNPALVRALGTSGAPSSARQDSDVVAALEKVAVPSDSGLPVELWSADGRRLAHIGTDIRGDSIAMLPPELRSRHGTRVSEVPVGVTNDSTVQMGALYPSSGRVYFWAVAPVMQDGQRIGAIVQQRHVVSNPQVKQMIRDMSGEEFTVFLRNVTDDFSSSIDGRPIPPAVRRDTTDSGYVATRADGARQIGYEQRVQGTPYIFSLEVPKRTIVAAPRATIRQLSLFSVLLLLGGVALTWALSRQITLPLVELTTATEAMAQGQYSRRVEHRLASSDEVERLGASFNRMASEVEASQQELASQVEEALATSEELEQTNEQLQLISAAADEARDAALDANRAKGDFLAVMSHELRTPLNAIGGYTEILQLGVYGEVNDAQQDALTRIARSQQTLLSLINDVLNFAKLEAGAVQYAVTDVPLVRALGVIEDFVAPQLRDKHMTYRLAPFDARVTAHVDADKLQQILINLLSNAVKYTPEGGEIDVSCEVEERLVRIHVADTGIGIAPDRLEKVFDPFIQVGRALNRPHEGVGLGLSISRNLALAMRGSLSVESVQGKGSRFTLTIPRGTDTTLPA